jgi:hypothetical protein
VKTGARLGAVVRRCEKIALAMPDLGRVSFLLDRPLVLDLIVCASRMSPTPQHCGQNCPTLGKCARSASRGHKYL